MSDLLWQPSAGRIQASNLHRFAAKVRKRYAISGDDYAALHRWSVENRADFWSEIWRHGGVIGEMGAGPVLVDDRMPGAKWFPAARLNFAQNLLRRRQDEEAPAIIFRREDGYRRVSSYRDLYRSVASSARAMRAMGIEKGDRVAGYLPNMPETVIAMLACASIGAIWSSCSPDFGAQGVKDRFGQIAPKLLFAADGYLYAGKHHDCIERLGEIARALPSLERIVIIPFTRSASALEKDLDRLPKAVLFEAFLEALEVPEAPEGAPEVDVSNSTSDPTSDPIPFEPLPFDHPLYIMYSSGTTGAPKCIVHGAGGTLLQHIKEISLHSDLKAGQRMLYLTTCGWMMWNWLVSALACEATVVLYDGSPLRSPLYPDGNALFDILDEEEIHIFGTSAKFIDAVRKQGIEPARSHALTHLETMLSTGSPLAPEGFDYVYRSIKRDICLSSISGGTDIMGCFALGNPTAPVRRGEIQCSGLGLDVHAFDDEGRSLVGEKGELVCTRAFPSMPLGFWNDPDGRRYHEAYFARYEGVWCHGDYVEISASGGMIIYGRSDAVLNPGGVRIGTAEIYRQVEGLDEITEALVVGQQWEGDVRIVLFVVPAPGVELNARLEEKIKREIRANTTPRHVPARIVAVSDIPRTRSGKITELAVRDIVHGRPVRNLEALANPEALEQFADRPELRS